jgi:hypothetical protein
MARPTAPPIITLLTDFGRQDHYVASMKGVMLQIAPSATLVDITHEIEPQDVTRATFLLRQIWAWFPPETVHLVVVDPKVGSRRRILAGRYGGQSVVCPDNGLISLVHRDVPIESMHIVENPRYRLPQTSSTFHGRDIMAPAAAYLATGVPLSQLGPSVDRVEIMQLPEPQIRPGPTIEGQVLFADHFGNLVTNITRRHLAALPPRLAPKVFLDKRELGPIRTAYYEVETGQPLALVGSDDHLEIAVNCGSAAAMFPNARQSTIIVR